MPNYTKDPNEIGALWTKTGAKGQYMTGTINNERVVVFSNTNRKSDKAPHWRVLKAKKREDDPRELADAIWPPEGDGAF